MAAVLIVDKEKNLRTRLTAHVRSLGHTAKGVGSAKEAMRTLSRDAFDIVLADVRMARMNGDALLREIKRGMAETVVVTMSGRAIVRESVAAMQVGACDYLVRPF